jgi:membrane protein implicated in regulation of membrane protease activity
MAERDRTTTSPADVAAEAGGLMAGLGLVTFTLFPFAVPLLALTIAPLVLLAVAAALLALPVVLPLWLVRLVLRRRQRPRPLHERAAQPYVLTHRSRA